MTAILHGRISPHEGLKEALEILMTLREINSGILEIQAPELRGRIGIAWGRFVTGALLDNGECGKRALRRLLALRAGQFSFIDMKGEPILELRQSLGIDLNAIAPYVTEMRPTLTPWLYDPEEQAESFVQEQTTRVISPAEPSADQVIPTDPASVWTGPPEAIPLPDTVDPAPAAIPGTGSAATVKEAVSIGEAISVAPLAEAVAPGEAISAASVAQSAPSGDPDTPAPVVEAVSDVLSAFAVEATSTSASSPSGNAALADAKPTTPKIVPRVPPSPKPLLPPAPPLPKSYGTLSASNRGQNRKIQFDVKVDLKALQSDDSPKDIPASLVESPVSGEPEPLEPAAVTQPEPPAVPQPEPPAVSQPQPPAVSQSQPPAVSQPQPPLAVSQPQPPAVSQTDASAAATAPPPWPRVTKESSQSPQPATPVKMPLAPGNLRRKLQQSPHNEEDEWSPDLDISKTKFQGASGEWNYSVHGKPLADDVTPPVIPPQNAIRGQISAALYKYIYSDPNSVPDPTFNEAHLESNHSTVTPASEDDDATTEEQPKFSLPDNPKFTSVQEVRARSRRSEMETHLRLETSKLEIAKAERSTLEKFHASYDFDPSVQAKPTSKPPSKSKPQSESAIPSASANVAQSTEWQPRSTPEAEPQQFPSVGQEGFIFDIATRPSSAPAKGDKPEPQALRATTCDSDQSSITGASNRTTLEAEPEQSPQEPDAEEQSHAMHSLSQEAMVPPQPDWKQESSLAPPLGPPSKIGSPRYSQQTEASDKPAAAPVATSPAMGPQYRESLSQRDEQIISVKGLALEGASQLNLSTLPPIDMEEQKLQQSDQSPKESSPPTTSLDPPPPSLNPPAPPLNPPAPPLNPPSPPLNPPSPPLNPPSPPLNPPPPSLNPPAPPTNPAANPFYPSLQSAISTTPEACTSSPPPAVHQVDSGVPVAPPQLLATAEPPESDAEVLKAREAAAEMRMAKESARSKTRTDNATCPEPPAVVANLLASTLAPSHQQQPNETDNENVAKIRQRRLPDGNTAGIVIMLVVSFLASVITTVKIGITCHWFGLH